MKRFILSQTLNTRDLGGYNIGNGRATAFNKFLRSDLPKQLSEEDIDKLLSNNIKVIVDLRSKEEIKKSSCAFKNNKLFKYYNYSLYGDGYVPKSKEQVAISYFEMLEEKYTVAKIMKIFAKEQDGILYHCTAGKDRTGVISALLLLLSGVSKEDILIDYEISNLYLSKLLQEFSKKNKEIDINIITPKKVYIEEFLHMFHEKYNSAENYLLEIGLSEEEIKNIRKKLIRESSYEIT